MTQQPHNLLKESMVNRLELAADLKNLTDFIKFVCDQAHRLKFSPQRIQEIELVLEEALVNIIEYAYPVNLPGRLILQFTDIAENRLSIEIRDCGVQFNPLAQSDPDVDIKLMERPVGGLGILLMKELADELTWHREKGENCFTLVFTKRHA